MVSALSETVPALPSKPVRVVVVRFDVLLSVTAQTPATVHTPVVSVPGAMTSRVEGSSSSVPALPNGARRSAKPVKLSTPLLDTSALPPSPPLAPPLARIVPAKLVFLSDHTTTEPPSPCCTALASSVALAALVVVCALATLGSLPCKPPPTLMLPPPALP